MTYMWPDFQLISSKNAYKLWKYRDSSVNVAKEDWLLVFVPGNRGSEKQARSLGSTLLRSCVERRKACPMVYSFDLNEEWSALSGIVMDRQIAFIQDSIEELQRQYPKKQLVLFGHSMGGILIRSLQVKPRLVVSLASPLEPVVYPWDDIGRLKKIYQKPCPDYPWIAINGGDADGQVVPSLTVSDCPNVLSIPSTNVYNSWSCADHLAILWCNGLITTLADALLEDATNSNCNLSWWNTRLTSPQIDAGKTHAQKQSKPGKLDTLYHKPTDALEYSGCNLDILSSQPVSLQFCTKDGCKDAESSQHALPSPKQAQELERLGRRRTFDDALTHPIYHSSIVLDSKVTLQSSPDWFIASCQTKTHSVEFTTSTILPWPYSFKTVTLELNGIKNVIRLPDILFNLVVLKVQLDKEALVWKNPNQPDAESFHHINFEKGQAAYVPYWNVKAMKPSEIVIYHNQPTTIHLKVDVIATILYAVRTYGILLITLCVPASLNLPSITPILLLLVGYVSRLMPLVIIHIIDAPWILPTLWLLAQSLVQILSILCSRLPRLRLHTNNAILLFTILASLTSPLFPKTLPIVVRGITRSTPRNVILAAMCIPGILAYLQSRHYFAPTTFSSSLINVIWTVLYNLSVYDTESQIQGFTLLFLLLTKNSHLILPVLSLNLLSK